MVNLECSNTECNSYIVMPGLGPLCGSGLSILENLAHIDDLSFEIPPTIPFLEQKMIKSMKVLLKSCGTKHKALIDTIKYTELELLKLANAKS